MSTDNIEIHKNGSKKLLVSFGGIKSGIGMPIYEFYKSLEDLKCDKIFIKDVNQAWYHKGVNSEIDDVYKLRSFLKSYISINSYSRIVFVGNSMGGYAAILFGSMLNVNHVLAFSPQTFIDKLNRFRFQDKRWSNELSYVYPKNSHQKKYYNLSSFLKKNKFATIFDIHYSEICKLDSIHAQRLKNINNINLYSYNIGDHNLIKIIRDEGNLFGIIYNAIYN